ncbi:O-antigen polymerase [Calothrix sp. NIES-4071]|nr:O-antigen polymerase [Calothrix sp. NIES-4071]BAZ54543.1 O-antigen polymerase [Calothrix sp. NIES-4105]
MNQILRFAEKAFIVLGLCFFSGVFGVNSLGLILPQAVITLIRFFLWGISTLLVCIFWKQTLVAAIQNKWLSILTGLTLLSYTWSIFPDVTLFHIRDILMMTSFGLYFAARFKLKDQIQLIAFTLLLGGILSTIISLGIPSIGVHGMGGVDVELGEGHIGAWKGVFGHKNILGSMMVLSSLAFFTLPKGTSSLYKWGGFSFSIVLMLLSTSRTSLVLSALLILIMLFYRQFRWQGKLSVIFLHIGTLILGCLTLFLLTYWVDLLTSLGRDATLTGRTYIWGTALTRLMERPFLGFGYSAFWAPGSRYALQASRALGSDWIPPHGHNGFVDLAVDVGLIGLSLFFITYFTAFAQSLKQAYATKKPEQLWPLAFLTFLAMNNVTESCLLYLGNMYWVLFITIVLTVNQQQEIKNNLNKLHNRRSKIEPYWNYSNRT